MPKIGGKRVLFDLFRKKPRVTKNRSPSRNNWHQLLLSLRKESVLRNVKSWPEISENVSIPTQLCICKTLPNTQSKDT